MWRTDEAPYHTSDHALMPERNNATTQANATPTEAANCELPTEAQRNAQESRRSSQARGVHVGGVAPAPSFLVLHHGQR